MKLNALAAGCFLLAVIVPSAHAQCSENNYIHDGAPSSQLDCQPLAALRQLSPGQMAAPDRELLDQRHADVVLAARFYGFDLDAPGWSYRQSISPLLRKHLLFSYINATPASRASHFTVLIPVSPQEKVQAVPAFSRGLHPYTLGFESKGSYSVFNRLLRSERGELPISQHSDWVDYAVLYLTLVGREPAIPIETDSVKANWDLTTRRGTTPVIFVARDGGAVIAFSDLSDATRTTGWKLAFSKQGQILKAERSDHRPQQVRRMTMQDETGNLSPTAAKAPSDTP